LITICDTGPLVAYLNRNDPHHPWAISVMKQVRPPMLTCEPVLTEVVYFLGEDGMPVDPLFQLLERDALRMDFDMSTHWPVPRVRALSPGAHCATTLPRPTADTLPAASVTTTSIV
jgi:predicted nucleic acid-binding protein